LDSLGLHALVNNLFALVGPLGGLVTPLATPFNFVTPRVSQLKQLYSIEFEHIQHAVGMALHDAHSWSVAVFALVGASSHQVLLFLPILQLLPENTCGLPFFDLFVVEGKHFWNSIGQVSEGYMH
jgi:hypothetical protein